MCGIDNLYNPIMFCKACYKHTKKVKTEGTCRKVGRVKPSDVVQQEVTSIKSHRSVRGTVKAAVLQGNT